jgi:hypothetical protein
MKGPRKVSLELKKTKKTERESMTSRAVTTLCPEGQKPLASEHMERGRVTGAITDAGVGELWLMGLPSVFVNKILVEHNHTHLFTYRLQASRKMRN